MTVTTRGLLILDIWASDRPVLRKIYAREFVKLSLRRNSMLQGYSFLQRVLKRKRVNSKWAH